MKLIDSLRIKIEAIGGSIDLYDDFFCLDTPPGYVWRCNGNPSVSIRFANSSETWLAQAIRQEKVNLDMGLQLVTDSARLAEIRWDNDNDNWGAPAGSPKTLSFRI